jgi:hypothetical protein
MRQIRKILMSDRAAAGVGAAHAERRAERHFQAHSAEGIGERCARLSVPRCVNDGQAGAHGKACPQQCDNGEQPQQARRGAGDRVIGPLALGFNAQVIARLAERQLQRPAPYKPADDVVWIAVGIGAQ